MMDLKMEVYTPGLELIGFLEIQRSVIWEEKAFTAGSFSVESLVTAESLALLQPENIIWIEGETAGIIEYVQEKADSSGPYITIKGRTLTGILDRRILWGLYSLKGTPPAIMHRLVDDCCINPTRGDTEARKIPGLSLLSPPAGGDTIQFQKTGGTLLEALEQLGETYGVAFGVRFNAAIPHMEFWTRWGQNRSVNQSANEPVFYSTELDDVLSSEYSYNSQDYRNISLVAGEGEGADRKYVVVEGDITEKPVTPQPPASDQYTIILSVVPSGGGVASGGGSVAAGASVTVTATPSSGYTFAEWRENGAIVSTLENYTFTANGDRALTAVFAAAVSTYTIAATVDPAGSGTVSGAGSYLEGETVTVKAIPGDGYKFTAWRENGQTVSESAEYTFAVAWNRTLVAVFAEAAVVGPSRLPDGYAEVEYIECVGNIGFTLDMTITPSTFRLVMDSEVYEYSGSTESVLASALSGNIATYVYRTGSETIRYQPARASNVIPLFYNAAISLPIEERTAFDWNWAENILTVGDMSVKITNTTNTSGAAYFLCSPASGNVCLPCKLYSAQIYVSGTLKKDLVPCINESTQEAGLFDLVSNTFMGNNRTANPDMVVPGPAV